MTKVEVYEQLIRQQKRAELIPFLVQLSKEDIVPIRQKTKELHRELDRMVEVRPNSWGSAITPVQSSMLFLASMRTFSRKEAMGNGLSIWDLRAAMQNTTAAFWQVLECARPAWLADWLLLRSEANAWAAVEYSVLRELEQRGFIEFQPRLFALAVPGRLGELGEELNRLETQPNNALVVIAERISQDKTFLERDLPLVFDFVTNVDGARAHVQKARPSNWHNLIPSFSWEQWNEQNPTQTVSWQQVLLHLVETGHLDRATLLTRCVLALRRDFRRPLLTWLKELLVSLKPTTTERLARQADLVELLAHPLPLVVNFAIEQLKSVWLEPGFDLAPLLLYADNLLTRPDLKTGLKTLLSGLLKLPRQNATHAPAVARLLAAALAHADSAVQERAAKGLATLLQAKKPLLLVEDHADIVLAINNHAELLAAPARTVLAAWLAAPAATMATARYAPSSQFVPEISADTAITPVADWHELLFLTGEVLHYDDPSAQERWLDGLLRLQGQLPAGYAEQLRPYLVQVLPALKHKPAAQAESILADAHFSGYWGLWQALLLSWAQGFRTLRVPGVSVQADHDTSDPLVLVERQRLAAAEWHLCHRAGLPLLSTPTHAPSWVAPSQLVQRLLRYEAAQVAPDTADLAVALARTAYAANSDAVPPLLAQLQHEGLRELLSWFFSPDATAPCLTPLARKSVLQQVAARLRSLLPGESATTEALDASLPGLWAVAARTKFPEQDFTECAALSGVDYPGVLRPWVPAWEFKVKTTRHVEYWKPGKPEISYHSVQLTFPSEYVSQGAPLPLLLYSLHARFRGMGHSHWQLRSTIRSLASLLPHNPAVLHWHMVRSATWTDKLETTERDIVLAALDTLLEAGPVFAESTTLLLATSLLHHTPSCRALALEVLLSACTMGRLQPAVLGHLLGRLLAAEYAPLARLADLLPQALAVSPETNDALRQTLDALLPALPTAPPRGLRKLLDLYADLRVCTSQPMPAAVQSRLHAWGTTASIKKAASILLTINY